MITCLHTAQIHVDTFGHLLPAARHVVRADLLERARRQGLDAVAPEVSALLAKHGVLGPVLCTCSTLGPLVDRAGQRHILRIDRPAMEQAVSAGSEVVIAICLESTRAATLNLFQEVAGDSSTSTLVMCDAAWPFFEAGDLDGFAKAIDQALVGYGPRILLAQASMACAAPLLQARGCEVFTTPQAAADAVQALENNIKDI